MPATALLLWGGFLLSITGLCGAAVFAESPEGIADGAALAVELTLPAGNGRTTPSLALLTAASDEERPAVPLRAPCGWLVTLPEGTTRVAGVGLAALAQGGPRPLPPDLVRLGRVMILRGVPVIPVSVDAAALQGAAAPGLTAIRLELACSGAAPARAEARGLSALRAETVGALLRGPESPAGRGAYLIITAPQFASALQDLVEWKTLTGFEVHVVTTDETGMSQTAIRDFIRTAYETWQNPPRYVLLVGDVEFIPTWNISGNVSDHPYACVDGGDFLPDLSVGRFSAKLLGEVAVQVAKTVGYESSPDTTSSSSWFGRALLVAGNLNSSTPVALNRWFRQELLAAGFTQADSVYYPGWYEGRAPITYFTNPGVSLINYRGWAYGITGWQAPKFISDDIGLLQNGARLPVVFSIVCHTGDYGNADGDCFGETWLKAGTVEAPKGAVGFIGTGEPWSHSRWNDQFDISLCDAICQSGLRELGAIQTAAKLSLLPQFPEEIYMDETVDPEESAEYYIHVYNILGDPSLEVCTETPHPIRVHHPRSMSFATNAAEIQITAADGTTPLAGVRLALVQGGALAGYGVSDGEGWARFSVALTSLGPIDVTATGSGVYPWRSVMEVIQPASGLTCTGASLGGSGFLVPGVATDLRPEVRNTGSGAIGATSATVSGPDGVELIESATSFGPLASGAAGTALEAVRIRVDSGTENGARLRFLVAPTIPPDVALPATEFWLEVAAPAFACLAQDDGGDGIFDPGEDVSLILTLRNDGPVAAGAIAAQLQAPPTGALSLTDPAGAFEVIAPGLVGSNTADPFALHIADTTAIGTVVPLTLHLTSAEGPQCVVPFNLIVGSADYSAPTGPDSRGYYAFDSADIDYPAQVPAFDWLECSTLYGGAGTFLSRILDNKRGALMELPFPFTYYGTPYDSVRISDNGWISFDTTYWYDVRNWRLPDVWGGACLVAPFWDNLVPRLDPSDDDYVPNTDGVYAFYDESQHRMVFEWSRMKNWEGDTDDYQTFELMLLDPAYYPTPTGDGEIIFQYKQISNDDVMRMYATVGIEDSSETVGLLYSYSNEYASGAAPLSPGLAIRITTAPPVYRPLTVTHFETVWQAEPRGVAISWELADQRPIAGLEIYRAAAGPESGCQTGELAKVHAGYLAPACRGWCDPSADPTQHYRYRLVAISAAGNTRILGETIFPVVPSAPDAGASLQLLGGSVSRGETRILLSTGAAAADELSVYDALGRRVRDLRYALSGGSGHQIVVWDGRDAEGALLPSGLYWVRLRADRQERTSRLLVIR